MKKRKRILFLVAALLALTVWDLSETYVAEATTGQVTVTGRIGETAKKEEKSDDDKKKTIVADASQLENGRLPQTGSHLNQYQSYIGFFIIGLLMIIFFLKRRFIILKEYSDKKLDNFLIARKN
ncbi:LPXTG cell wall anchor domain-containing protein [Enterococcus entomosocium]|uniref:LPXTG cell wall anchor domain-containing protein n=1 Tax=Enterococcus entomosocium TaxID=3034352 RepID=UPI0026479444|nr:LPXTG cell wall anchor domain-containing protein [Enterococcus entomosocium]